jgi:hypothetical protein
VKTVSFVDAVDELLYKFVIKRECAAATGALEMVVIRLADPFEHGVARA